MRFIVYAQFGDSTVPIFCKNITPNPFKDGFVTLGSVTDLKDNVYTNLEVEDLVIPKSMITYFLKGKLKDSDEKSSNDVSKTYDSEGDV